MILTSDKSEYVNQVKSHVYGMPGPEKIQPTRQNAKT